MPRCVNTLTLGTFFKIGLLGFFRMLWRISGLSKAFFLIDCTNFKMGNITCRAKKMRIGRLDGGIRHKGLRYKLKP